MAIKDLACTPWNITAAKRCGLSEDVPLPILADAIEDGGGQLASLTMCFVRFLDLVAEEAKRWLPAGAPAPAIIATQGYIYWRIVKIGPRRSTIGFVRIGDGAIFRAKSWSLPVSDDSMRGMPIGYITDEEDRVRRFIRECDGNYPWPS